MLEKLNGGPIPDVKFFNMDAINIKGRKVRALRHGMAGAPGLEIWGPYAEGEEIRDGDPRGRQGLRPRAGRRPRLRDQHARVGLDSVAAAGRLHRREDEGVPRVAAGQRLRSHRLDRRQLRLEQHRGLLHDAVRAGLRPVREVRPRLHRPRSAREEVASEPQRKKVTFAWNGDDVAKVCRVACSTPGDEHYKYIDLPLSNYASSSYDKVMKGGKVVGLSMFSGYSYNERSMLSLGVVDPDIKVGDELTLVWGEENGGTKKTTVERHKQTEIRVTVGPVPYGQMARETYRPK